MCYYIFLNFFEIWLCKIRSSIQRKKKYAPIITIYQNIKINSYPFAPFFFSPSKFGKLLNIYKIGQRRTSVKYWISTEPVQGHSHRFDLSAAVRWSVLWSLHRSQEQRTDRQSALINWPNYCIQNWQNPRKKYRR